MKKIFNKYWYLILLFVFCVTPIFWFLGKGDAIIDGVDTNFPLNPVIWLGRRFFMWSGISNGGSNFSSNVAGIFFHIVQAVPFVLGFNIQAVNILSLTFWFSAIVLASFIFAKILIPKSRTGQLIFVVFYVFNTYLFNTWENVKVTNLSVAVCMPAVLALLISKKEKLIGQKKFVLLGALVSIFATGTGINPAYFLTIIIAILIFTFLNIRYWRNSALLLLVLLSINFYWIAPTLEFLFFSDHTIKTLTDIGFMNWVNDLSKNTSALNVLRQQGAWDWYVFDPGTVSPSYLPYVVNYLNNFPFIAFSFFLPFCAILSFIFPLKDKLKDYSLFGVFLVIGIFLGMGTHQPTGFLFSFFSQHIPFFSFFRSPWYIFTPFVTISMAGLTAFLWYRIEKLKILNKVLLTFIGIILVELNVIYTYPIITGKVFRPTRSDGFYVHFPKYVFESENYLNDLRKQGDIRLLSYPDDAIERFDWGYRGLDTILSLFSNVETINPTLSQTTSFLEDYRKIAYWLLKRGEYQSVVNSLSLISSNGIFYKSDASSLSPKLDENKLGKIIDTKKIGEWLFALTGDQKIKAFIPNMIYKNYGDNKTLANAASVLPKDVMVLNKNDSEAEEALKKSGQKTFAIVDAKIDSIEDLQKISFEINSSGNYFLYIEKYLLDYDKVSATLGTQYITKNISDDFIKFGPINLKTGDHTIVLSTGEKPYLIKDQISVNNDGKEKYSNYLMPKGFIFDPLTSYELLYSYNYQEGRPAITEAIQYNDERFIQSFINYEEEKSYNSVLEIMPIRTPSKLDLFLTVRIGEQSQESVSSYSNVKIARKFDNLVFLVEDSGDVDPVVGQDLDYKKETPVKYDLNITNSTDDGVFFVVSENYDKDWVLSDSQDYNHFTANGYANGWYIPSIKNKKLTLFYTPQKTFDIAFIISCILAILWIVSAIKKDEK